MLASELQECVKWVYLATQLTLCDSYLRQLVFIPYAAVSNGALEYDSIPVSVGVVLVSSSL
jgi:hypothetical protein